MAVIDDVTLENWFVYHLSTSEEVSRMAAIRAAAHVYAKVIVANTPACPDQTAAIRKVRESLTTANLSIACGGV